MGAGTERTGQRREKTGSNTAARAFGEVRRNPRQPLLIRHIVPILFSIPHRPTKLLLEPAVCKSLKIKEVWSRALASLLITERVICGNRAGKRTAQGATRATSLRFSLGEQAKKILTDQGWDFEYWWWNTEPNLRPLSEADSNRTRKCPCFRANVLFPSRALSTEERRGLGWRARKQSLRRTRVRFRVLQSNRRPH